MQKLELVRNPDQYDLNKLQDQYKGWRITMMCSAGSGNNGAVIFLFEKDTRKEKLQQIKDQEEPKEF